MAAAVGHFNRNGCLQVPTILMVLKWGFSGGEVRSGQEHEATKEEREREEKDWEGGWGSTWEKLSVN